MDSSENLVKECFANRIFFFKEIPRMDINDKTPKYKELREALENIQKDVQGPFYCY
jgi:hypothetical protein